MFVQVPAPAGERWNCTEARPEPPSAASLEEIATALPRTIAAAAGAVTEPVGLTESFVNVSTVAFDVFPAASVPVTDSVGLAVSPLGQAKLLVVVYGPPTGAFTVCGVCVQPPTVPPRTGKTADAGPDPPSLTVFLSWKLPAAAP